MSTYLGWTTALISDVQDLLSDPKIDNFVRHFINLTMRFRGSALKVAKVASYTPGFDVC